MGTATEGVAYKKECILPAAKCSEAEKRTAMQDYVVAVYGTLGGARYDGVLKAEEGKTLSKLVADQKKDLLSAARAAFFNNLSPVLLDACGNGSVVTRVATSKKYGDGKMIIVQPGCIMPAVTEYDTKGLYAEVAANPEDWLFLAEDWSDNVRRMSGRYAPEIVFFGKLADMLGVRIENPTTSIYHQEVIAELKKRHGLTVYDFAVTEVWQYLTILTERLPNVDTRERLSAAIKEVYKNFRDSGIAIDEATLFQTAVEFIAVPPGISMEEYRYQKGTALKERNLKISRVVEEMSRAKLEKVFADRSPRKVLFIGGPRLTRYFDGLYKTDAK